MACIRMPARVPRIDYVRVAGCAALLPPYVDCEDGTGMAGGEMREIVDALDCLIDRLELARRKHDSLQDCSKPCCINDDRKNLH